MSKMGKGEFALTYKRTSGIAAYFMTDKSDYVIAGQKPASHEEFKNLAKMVLGTTDDVGLNSFLLFLQHSTVFSDLAKSMDEDIVKRRKIAFRLQGEAAFLHERQEAIEKWKLFLANMPGKSEGRCLITNRQAPILPVHPSIRNKKKAFISDKGELSIVSFNFDAVESFGKGQSYNAPISEQAAFAYTTALNHLLAPDSPRKVQMGDTTMVFWTDSPGEADKLFSFSMGGKQTEDESLGRRLGSYLSDIVRGRYPEALGRVDTPFYVLGLSPNAARLSVRFWLVSTVGDMVENLGAHFRALAIQRRFDGDPEHPSPWQLLKELAPQRDSKNISPLLYGQMMRSIIQNLPYPQTLLSSALGRIRADKEINYLRAALIKAFLVRNRKQEMHMTLDTTNTDIGYRLGRLFAIVERIQEEAVPGANATVRDRFFSSATATPGHTFPIILKNAQHGLAKIRKDKPGWAVTLEKQIQDIVGGIDAATGFPASLSSEKQGMFILGYYQQRQDFFTKKENKTEG